MSRKGRHRTGTAVRKGAETQTSAREHWIRSPITPRLLPLKAAAQALGLTTWSLREACWRGDIPIVRFPNGRKIFIDTKDLEEFITRNKTRIV
jgi:hypothetical protein